MTKQAKKKQISLQRLYQYLITPILSKDEGIDPETLTQLALSTLGQISIYRNSPGISTLLKSIANDLQITDKRLEQTIFGCQFKNPIGLAAGFDKNGVAAGIWDHFGFGFAELGTVTFHAQIGNQRPRLFRLAKEKAALNRMGFNNNGAAVMRTTLERQSLISPGKRPLTIGLNFGKSKITALEKAPEDYFSSVALLAAFADYVVINISSPNTPGLRELQNANLLKRLLKHLKKLPDCPPLLVKIAPDLSNEDIDELAKVALQERISGLIAVNTSTNRLGLEKRLITQTGKTLAEEIGGLSGQPLQGRAIEVLRRLRTQTGQELPLVGVGGIDSPKCAWERITAGASLLQLYTGWIFQGPILVPQILEGLLSQLEKHGLQHISEAVGSELPWT